MTRTERYTKIISEYISEADYPALPRALYEPIRYTMEDGGKRLRPLFVLMACGLLRDDVYECLPAAAAVEIFHNSTLLHDDIMDNSPLRRGRITVHEKWDSNVAIISGDALMIRAYGELARTRVDMLPAVMDYFNEAAVKVCEGQQYDMDFEERDDVNLHEYIAMIELKTVALFVGAVSMGAVIGGASARQIELLRRFALEFGVAFQIQDDLLDSFGDDRLGKTVGGDILEGKKTFLKMTAMAAAEAAATEAGAAAAQGAADRAVLATIHKDPGYSPEEKIARVQTIYERYDVRKSVEDEISRRFTSAVASLDQLGTSVGYEGIEEFKKLALNQSGRIK